jgi:DUF2934 family protein
MAKSTKRTTKNVVTMPKLAATTTRVASQPGNLTDDEIAKRAFELYCERGRHDGHDVDDWLQAERELQTTDRSTAA